MWIVPFSRCTSSPERAAACLPTSSSASAPSVPSRLRNTRNESSSTASPASPSGTTSAPSARTIPTAPNASLGCANIEPRSLSREVSRAKTSARRASERASRASALASGGSLPESFARFDPDSCSWRIPQCLFTGDWSAFLGTWPRAGMMRSGECWRLQTLERGTNGSESGLPPLCGTMTMQGGGFPSASHNGRRNPTPTPEELCRIRCGVELPPSSRLHPDATTGTGATTRTDSGNGTSTTSLFSTRRHAHTTGFRGGANLK